MVIVSDDSAAADGQTPRRKPVFRVDLDAVRERWLSPCGPCDYGAQTRCTCLPEDADYRPTLLDLAVEVERTRELARELATSLLVFAELGGMLDTYRSTDSRVSRALEVLDVAPDDARAVVRTAVQDAAERREV